MANLSIIMGKSGVGKSTSVKNLNPEETLIIRLVDNKPLPFKGSNKLYVEKKNLFNLNEAESILKCLQWANGQEKIKTIVCDDFTYLMRYEQFRTINQSGFAKYSNMALHFQQVVSFASKMRNDINIYLMMHPEEVFSNNNIIGYKAATVGKLVDNSFNPLEIVTTLLFATIRYNDEKKPEYGFITHRCMEGEIEIPAKSPDGMFEEDWIPNDLTIVNKAMNEYYN